METRYQRIAREQAERQSARAQRLAIANKPKRARKRIPHPDDFDPSTPFGTGDNLGESPDY